MPRYRYAFNRTGTVVDIRDLPADRRQHPTPFRCLACDQQLVAKTKGERREKHFAHQVAPDMAVVCNPETYLHRTAKYVLRDRFRQCLQDKQSFPIELVHPATCVQFADLFSSPCHGFTVPQVHDLTRYYDTAALEQRDGQFIPDLLLTHHAHPKRKLYLEIATTHVASPQKRRAGQRIIEITVTSDDDLDLVRQGPLAGPRVTFLNFDQQVVTLPTTQCRCATVTFSCLFVYASGRTYLAHATPPELLARRGRATYAAVFDSRRGRRPPPRAELYRRLVMAAAEAGFPSRSCFLCQHAEDNQYYEPQRPVYCARFRKPCRQHEAQECVEFRVREPLGHPSANRQQGG